MKRTTTILTGALLTLSISTSVNAQNYYCVKSPDGDGHLLTIDISDGTLIDSVTATFTNDPDPIDGFNGMARHPSTSDIYVVAKDDGGDRHLGIINPANGEITSIGVLSFSCSSLTFDGSGNLYGMNGSSSTELYSIDPATAASTLIHDFADSGDDGEAISVNTTDGLLYRYDGGSEGRLSTLDLTTFTETIIDTLSGIDTWGPGLHYRSATNDFILAAGETFYTLGTDGATVELGNIDTLDLNGNFKGLVPVSGANIHEAQTLQDIKVYPNPSAGTINIEASEKVEISVTTLTGELILESDNAQSITLKTPGIYLLHFTNQYGNLVKRIVIK